jgi:Holliday junction DNA helicase RuvA
MFDYIKGTLSECCTTDVTVEAHGVGYHLSIPLSTFEKLPAPQGNVRLFTHFYVREDAQRLFGFLTKEEREVFRALIAINKIGPKIALSILSGISISDLVKFVTLADSSRLKAISGVGAKTAERLVIELSGKLKGIKESQPVKAAGKAAATTDAPDKPARRVDSKHEAFGALMALGYNERLVAPAIQRVENSLEPDSELPVEEWIKKALKVI